jgi:hypothetical protein
MCHGSLDQKHPIWKNLEVQFSINQVLKNEIEKTISIIQKNYKK